MTDELPGLKPEINTKLQQLQPGSYCVHRSWGIGKISSWEQDLGRLIIDFANKPGHAMEFEYAAESLKPLDPGHIEARIFGDVAAVQALAENNALELMQIIIQSLQQEASPERIERLLMPAVISAGKWKKWWDGAKRVMKKDFRFEIPAKRNLPILFHDEGLDQRARAFEEFQKTIGIQQQLPALGRLEKLWKVGDDKQQAIQVVDAVNRTLAATPRTQIGAILEFVLLRDDFIAKARIDACEPSLETFLPGDPFELADALNEVSGLKQQECLERIHEILGDKWAEVSLAIIIKSSGRMMEAILAAFKKENRLSELHVVLERLIRERRLTPELLVWICKSKEEVIHSLMGTQMFAAIISALEYDQLADYKKGTRLHDLLINDKTVVRDLLASASEQEVRDITRTILLTSVFEELNKRSLLASLVKLYPFVQSMIIGGEENKTQGGAIIVSWPSLERRKAELEEIINKKIPENSKDIALARSYGDLSENHEFKAAKEMQTVLMRRRGELEAMLMRAQGTDFKGVDASEVNIGTRVRLTDLQNNNSETYTILGAWDSDPEKGIISYLTALGQSLSKRKVGDTVEIPVEGSVSRRVRIESIEAYHP